MRCYYKSHEREGISFCTKWTFTWHRKVHLILSWLSWVIKKKITNNGVWTQLTDTDNNTLKIYAKFISGVSTLYAIGFLPVGKTHKTHFGKTGLGWGGRCCTVKGTCSSWRTSITEGFLFKNLLDKATADLICCSWWTHFMKTFWTRWPPESLSNQLCYTPLTNSFRRTHLYHLPSAASAHTAYSASCSSHTQSQSHSDLSAALHISLPLCMKYWSTS